MYLEMCDLRMKAIQTYKVATVDWVLLQQIKGVLKMQVLICLSSSSVSLTD